MYLNDKKQSKDLCGGEKCMSKRRNLTKDILQNIWVNGKCEAYASTDTLHIALGLIADSWGHTHDEH